MIFIIGLLSSVMGCAKKEREDSIGIQSHSEQEEVVSLGHYTIDSDRMYSTLGRRYSCSYGEDLFYLDIKQGGVVMDSEGTKKVISASFQDFYCIYASDKYVYFETDRGLFQYDREGNLVAQNEDFYTSSSLVVTDSYVFGDPLDLYNCVSADDVSESIEKDELFKEFSLVNSWDYSEPDISAEGKKGKDYSVEIYRCEELCVGFAFENGTGSIVDREKVFENAYTEYWENRYKATEIGAGCVFDDNQSKRISMVDYVSCYPIGEEACFICEIGPESNVACATKEGALRVELPRNFDYYTMYVPSGIYLGDRTILLSGKLFSTEGEVMGLTHSYYHDHDEDYLCQVDFDSGKVIKEKGFQKEDYLIYADDSQYIIYNEYCLKYYDMKTDELIQTTELPELRDGYDYTFELCGDKIFLFEERMNSELNRPEVLDILNLYSN